MLTVPPVVPRVGAPDAQPTDRVDGPQPGPIVSLQGVSRRFVVGEGVVNALLDADLEVRPGEFVVVLGPSGSGKTTLLNLIGALDTASAGDIVVGGRQLAGLSRGERSEIRRRTVAFVFQAFNLFPSLTALENVRFGADVAGRPDADAVARQLLADVDLADRLEHFPAALSGGEQQRVAIARALATGNPVLLADEPTGELDFRTGVAVLDLLRRQAEAGRAVLVVTHNREVSRIADRVVELSGGRIVGDGPPRGGRADVADLHW
ncbi:MAG TPA: ABC transporter ATP-binding protein [Candidatus Limnocylindrales bacterium]|nr:ABC transporter ATP-binding protein [Candidatus Limnocylindrales bacterium]